MGTPEQLTVEDTRRGREMKDIVKEPLIGRFKRRILTHEIRAWVRL